MQCYDVAQYFQTFLGRQLIFKRCHPFFQNTIGNNLEKGMTPFKDQLSPQKRLEVLSYIVTLHGTTPANPKAAEGDKLDWPY
jgi:hypothetical protein